MGFDLCIIADDFTGAGDSVIQFKKSESRAFWGQNGWEKSDISPYDVLVVSTDSRFMDKEQSYLAAKNTVNVCKRYHSRCFYKKIDSTLRGNVADEIAAVMHEAGYPCALVAPAAPKNGRTLVGGRCMVDGKLVGSSPATMDFFTPVQTLYIPQLFEQRFPGAVAHMDLSVIRSGEDAFLAEVKKIKDTGKKIIIADSKTMDDLRIVASVKNDPDLLFCGASGLAEAMSRRKNTAYESIDFPGVSPSEILFLVGSVTETSRQQVEILIRSRSINVLTVEIPGLLNNEKAEISRLLSLYRSMPADRPVLVDTLAENYSSHEITAVCGKLGIKEKELGIRVSSSLGKMVSAMFECCAFQALFVTGGDTAAGTAESLGINGIELLTEVLPGIPLGRFFTDLSEHQVYLVSKAGGFGPPDTLMIFFLFVPERKHAHQGQLMSVLIDAGISGAGEGSSPFMRASGKERYLCTALR